MTLKWARAQVKLLTEHESRVSGFLNERGLKLADLKRLPAGLPKTEGIDTLLHSALPEPVLRKLHLAMVPTLGHPNFFFRVSTIDRRLPFLSEIGRLYRGPFFAVVRIPGREEELKRIVGERFGSRVSFGEEHSLMGLGHGHRAPKAALRTVKEGNEISHEFATNNLTYVPEFLAIARRLFKEKQK